jgi:hypothetical protein
LLKMSLEQVQNPIQMTQARWLDSEGSSTIHEPVFNNTDRSSMKFLEELETSYRQSPSVHPFRLTLTLMVGETNRCLDGSSPSGLFSCREVDLL